MWIPRGYSKVFSLYQDRNPRSFIHDVDKLATADVRAAKTLFGIYYQPVDGAGVDIDWNATAAAFTDATERWTAHNVAVEAVVPFSGLQHKVHRRGAMLVWRLAEQPEQYC